MSQQINQVYQSSVSNVDDQNYVLPAGTFVFLNWSAGTELFDGSSVKIELWWDQDGTGANNVLVDAIYTASETYQHALDPNTQYTTDGTNARFHVIRTVLSDLGSPREIYAQVQGTIL